MTTTAPDLAARTPGEPITVGDDGLYARMSKDGSAIEIGVDGGGIGFAPDYAHALAAAITTLASAAGHPAPVPPATVALVERLCEALEPFSAAADVKLCGEWLDRERISGTDTAFHVTFGDLRTARAALIAARAWRDGQPVADVAGAAK